MSVGRYERSLVDSRSCCNWRIRLRTFGLVGGSGGLGGTTGFDFATGLGSVVGLAIILTGAAGLLAGLVGAAMAAFFLAASSLRVAFKAGRTLAGFELLADFEITGFVAVWALLGWVLLGWALLSWVFIAGFFELSLFKLALAATAFPVFALATGFADDFAAVFDDFPFKGVEAELFVSGFSLTAAFVFLAMGFDEDSFAFATFAGFFATTDLPTADLCFAPNLLAALTVVFFFDALATAFTNRC